MNRLGPMIADAAHMAVLYAERLLVGVDAASFARLARPGGAVVTSNHPAFVFGHLGLYPARAIAALGLPVGDAAPPPDYEALFKAGHECRDDPAATIYPSMRSLTEFFFASSRRAIERVRSADDERFDQPNPAEGRMRELFPKVGGAVIFYLVGHSQQHLGQMSAWRRAMGLPPA